MTVFYLFLSALPESVPSWFLWAVPLLVGAVGIGTAVLALSLLRAEGRKDSSSEDTGERL